MKSIKNIRKGSIKIHYTNINNIYNTKWLFDLKKCLLKNPECALKLKWPIEARMTVSHYPLSNISKLHMKTQGMSINNW
jgi:hypothetical protein